jgi:rare lipoprotein A
MAVTSDSGFSQSRSVKSPQQYSPLRNLVYLASVIGSCFILANCSSGINPQLGVKASPRVVAEGKPVPKGGGRNQLGKPYTVGGKTYTPREETGYTQEGIASWYGSEFHGRLTSNGEVYDNDSLSAAHPTMPLPSYARVTNVSTGASVIVRVNDRGPFNANRLVDVSRKTADLLGFRRAGMAKVRVDYVGRASLSGSDDKKLLATYRAGGETDSLKLASLKLDTLEPNSPVAGPAPAVQAATPVTPAAIPARPVPQPAAIPMPPSAAPTPDEVVSTRKSGGMGGPYYNHPPVSPAASLPSVADSLPAKQDSSILPPPDAAPAAAELGSTQPFEKSSLDADVSRADQQQSPSPAARVASAVPVAMEPMPLMAPSLMSSQGLDMVAPSLDSRSFKTQ